MSDPGIAHIVLTRTGPSVPWVGQMVTIDVALFRPRVGEGELPPFSLDDPELSGALALFRPDVPPPSESSQDGVTYLVQHRTLLLFPQEDGTIVLPALTARFDDPVLSSPVRIQSEPLRFSAAMPRGQKQGTLLVARALQLKTSVDRPLTGLRVGDGFTRSIVLTADDTDPIMLPVLSFEAVDGLRVYPAEPRVLASSERGATRASRSYQATYVVERVGHYELPALSLRWLDPGTGRYATAQAAPISFWARPNPSLGLSAFGTAPGLGLSLMLGAVLLLSALCYVVVRRLRTGPFAWERRFLARRAEQRAFWAFQRALGHDSPLALLGRAYAWLALLLPGAPRTLARLRAASSESAQALRSWEEQSFGSKAGSVAAPHLARVFARARRALVRPARASSVSAINPCNDSREESS